MMLKEKSQPLMEVENNLYRSMVWKYKTKYCNCYYEYLKILKKVKPITFVQTCFVLLLLLSVMQSCTKDEVSSIGTVKVTFVNHPSDLTVIISPVENSQIAITDWLTPDANGSLTYNLNPGNYILSSSGSTFFGKVGFQIKAGETTVVSFDSTNSGHVQ